MAAKRTPTRCPRCERTDPPEGFYGNGYCRPCGAAYHRARRADPATSERVKRQHREHYQRTAVTQRAAARDYGQRLKLAAVEAYGGRCACCDEAELAFLAIDHVAGGGSEHRRSLGVSAGYGFYRWLRREGYPPGFRVLCHNCNNAVGLYGRCPHPGGVTRG